MNTESFLKSLFLLRTAFTNKILTKKFFSNLLSIYYALWLTFLPVVQALSYPQQAYAQAQTVTVEPTDDVFVESGSPTSTFTTDTFLRVKDRGASSTRESNLKFLINGLGSVAQAKLYVYARVSESGLPANAPSNLSVYGIANDVWDQDTSSSTLTPTWNTKLALGSKIGETTVSNNGSDYQWYSIDVTSYIQAQQAANDSIVSLGLAQEMNDVGNMVVVRSREGVEKPYLELTLGTAPSPSPNPSPSPSPVPSPSPSPSPSPTPTPSPSPSATPSPTPAPQTIQIDVAGDTYAENGNPTTNYGGATSLYVKEKGTSSTRDAYLKFNITSAPSIGTAKLKLFGKINESSQPETVSAPVTVAKVADVAWTETGLNWNNRPVITTADELATFTVTGNVTQTWYEVDVTNYVKAQKQAGATFVTLGLTQNMNDQGWLAAFRSRENSTNKPILEVTTGSAPSPTPAPTPTPSPSPSVSPSPSPSPTPTPNTAPTISLTKPSSAGEAASSTYTITWTDTDPDDDARISLFYDKDNSGKDGILIAQNISENADGSSDSYTWDVKNVGPGTYYIYGLIEDDRNLPAFSYAAGSISVADNLPTGEMSGSTDGKANVTPTGASSYSIPLTVSPGSAGVTPQLALSYSSMINNGLVGMGWAVEGLSMISRCGSTWASDLNGDQLDGVDFDSKDKFCLDGERLMVTSGNYGAVTSQYRTEHDSFSRITASANALGSSPASFVVEKKDGQIVTYTAVPAQGRSEALLWVASKIEDRMSNYILIDYIKDQNSGEFYPDKIRYTGNDAKNQSPYNEVSFEYEARPDVLIGYVSGSKSVLTRRINKIVSKNNGAVVRDYRLAYALGQVSQKSHLVSVTECGSDGQCFAPTQFSWDANDPKWGSFVTSSSQVETLNFLGAGSGTWSGHTGDASVNFIGDYNGDGADDIMGSAGNSLWDVRLSNAINNFQASSAQWAGHNGGANNNLVGDYNRDGNDDIMKWSDPTETGTSATTRFQWKLWLSNKSSFINQSALWNGPGPVIGNGANDIKATFRVGDFDGNGYKDDLIRYIDTQENPNQPGKWVVFHSNGSSAFERMTDAQGNNFWDGHSGGPYNNFVGDFNGDGKDDIIANVENSNGTPTTTWHVALNVGRDFTGGGMWTGHKFGKANNLVGDFNGDGKDDIAAYDTDKNNGTIAVCFSTGSGFSCKDWQSNFSNNPVLQVADLNKDGKDDLLQQTGSGNWKVGLSGYSIQTQYVGGFNNPASKIWYSHSGGLSRNVTGDFNGDGKMDMAGWTGANNQWHVVMSTGQGFTAGASWTGPKPNQDDNFTSIKIGDFNGDGRTDLAGAAGSTWTLALANRAGTNFDIYTSSGPGAGSTAENTVAGDFNGDGKTDLAGRSQGNQWNVWMANGTGTGFTEAQGAWTGPDADPKEIFVADFNGDGRADLAAKTATPNEWHVTLSSGSNFNDDGSGYWAGGPNTINKDTVLGDFNGDGKADLTGYTGADGRWHVALSTGRGFANIGGPNNDGFWIGHLGGKQNNVVGDFNGDGLTDLAGYSLNGKIWHVTLSTGTNFGGQGSGLWKGEEADATATLVADFTGDGKSDMAGWTNDVNKWHVVAPDGMKQDLLSSVKDGNGAETKFNYSPITDNTVHQRDTDAVYPRYDLSAPLYVVTKLSNSDGKGGFNTYDYTYYGAESQLRGRGFRGFRQVRMVDNQRNLITDTYYEQDHLYQGMPVKMVQQLTNGNLVQVVNNTLSYLPTVNAGITFAFVSKEEKNDFEINSGCKLNANLSYSCAPYRVTTTDRAYSTPNDVLYGNVSNVKISYNNGAVTETQNTYINDTNQNWILGRLSQATVIHKATGQSDQSQTAKYTYFATGLLLSEVTAAGTSLESKKEYTYDQYGNLTQSKLSATNLTARTMKTEYDNLGRFITKKYNSINQSETENHEPLLGNISSKTDLNGLVSTVTYDGFGRPLVGVSPMGNKTWTRYLKCTTDCVPGAVYKVFELTSTGSPKITQYGILDQELRQEMIHSSGQRLVTDTEYDTLLQPVKKTQPYFDGQPILSETTAYDELGRAELITHADNTTTSLNYLGLSIVSFNQLNQQNRLVSDAEGQKIESYDNANKVVKYKYDPRGNLIEMADPNNNLTKMEYNVLDKRTKLIDPDLGTQLSSYNAYGELTETTDAKGLVTTFSYDNLGRMVLRHLQQEGDTAWEFDTAANAKGALAKVTNYNGHVETYAYNTKAQLISTTVTVDSKSFVTTQDYNNYGLPSYQTYPSGEKVLSIPTVTNEVAQIRDGNSLKLYWQANSRNRRGQVNQERFGNGLLTSKAYSQTLGTLDTIQTGTSSAVQNLKYNFDVLGNLKQRQDLKRNLTESFTYDGLNRLSTASVTGQSSLTMAYDALGNITSKSDVGTYSYGTSRPHAVSSISGAKSNQYSYDLNGNRVSSNTQNVTYTSFDKVKNLTQGTTQITLSYDSQHDRFKQVAVEGSNTTTTYYVGSYEEVQTGSSLLKKHYITTSEGIVAIKTINGSSAQMLYTHGDHLGSIETITNDVGGVVESYSYDAWGLRRNPQTWQAIAMPSTAVNRGFVGNEHLDALSLINMNGRMYDPVIGQFISPDPHIQEPGYSQSLNRYSYVMNNPLSVTDPTGYNWFSDFFHENLGFILSIGTSLLLGPAGIGVMSFLQASIVGSFVGSFSTTLIAGGSIGDALRAGIKSGAMAYAQANAFDFVGHHLFPNAESYSSATFAPKVVAHGVVGGTFSVLSGGKFAHGFWSTAASALAAPAIGKIGPEQGGVISQTLVASVVGGTVSEALGGKFANGAMTASFSHLYNFFQALAIPAILVEEGALSAALATLLRLGGGAAVGAAAVQGVKTLSDEEDYSKYYYHYTDAAGRNGILSSNFIRLNWEREIFISPELFFSGTAAADRLAIPNTPIVGYFRIPRSMIDQSSIIRQGPADAVPIRHQGGTGYEIVINKPVLNLRENGVKYFPLPH